MYSSASHSIISSNRFITSSKFRYSEVIGAKVGPTWIFSFSSTPPLMAYRRALARLARAPKNCICLPTRIADTQQAMA
ncbi:hypothetical protein D3C76_982890 [compost metagenome]